MMAEMTGVRGTWFDSDRGQYELARMSGKGYADADAGRCRVT
jgi:hypothetical protein